MRTGQSAVVLLVVFVAATEAIKCKCTKESETVKCHDGVCEMDGGSCLMLDHPTMGMHYTCHTKSMKDGFCKVKTSKSGADVKICGCEASDFCNYSYWPDKARSQARSASAPPSKTDTAEQTAAATSYSTLVGVTVALIANRLIA